jgi:hypothetical protein
VGHHRAGGDALAAADALDGGADLAALAGFAGDAGIGLGRARGREGRPHRAQLLAERRHVDDEVAKQGEVVERPHGERAAEGGEARATRHAQRSRPLTTIAQEPHIPTRHA